MSQRRKLFYGFTAAIIALLLALPSTGWLGRRGWIPVLSSLQADFRYFATPLGQYDPDRTDREQQRVIERNPNDFELQYGYAVENFGDEGLRRLKALAQRYPNNSSIIAAELIDAEGGRIRNDRPDDWRLLRPSDALKETGPVSLPDPAVLADFEAEATAGERAEPDNAFFTFEKAFGYFAAHRDAEAITAWIAAGNKPVWNEHLRDATQARECLDRALSGGKDTGTWKLLEATADGPMLLNSHFRSTALAAATSAIRVELAGKTEEGFQIRKATRSIGERMQLQSTDFVGNMVGMAVRIQAVSRPGGAQVVKYTGSMREAKVERDAYTSYLVRIGHPEEATAYTRAHKDYLRLSQLGRVGMNQYYWPNIIGLFACYAGDVILIAAATFSLAFGGVFALVYRFSPGIQKGLTLQPSARWGASLGFAAVVAGGVAAGISARPMVVLITECCVGVIAALIASPLLMRLSIRQVGHGLCVLAATLGSTVFVAGAGAAVIFLFTGYAGLPSIQGVISPENPEANALAPAVPFCIAGIMLLLPVTMLLAFVAFSRILRVPIASGVTRGMRSFSGPLACILTVCWIICLLATMRCDNIARVDLEHIAKYGELQTFAHLAGSSYDLTQAVEKP